jgi:antirestriction protein ArdC/phage/plasmid primase-like uncharacterized protein
VGLSVKEAQALVIEFVRMYPGARAVPFKIRESLTELYGENAKQLPPTMKGGYINKKPYFAMGKTWHGRVDVVLANAKDGADFMDTLKHEVFGHFGVNTFRLEEKELLLSELIKARDGDLSAMWDDVDRRYSGESIKARAEEVFAMACEDVSPVLHVSFDDVQAEGFGIFQDVCRSGIRPMTKHDLMGLAYMVADGLHKGIRVQQTFPRLDEPKKRIENVEEKIPFFKQVADRLIEQLKQGTAPWQKPWKPGRPGGMLPINATTGKRYKGVNALQLLSRGFSDPRWLTYKQGQAIGAQVRKGEKGTTVLYYKFKEEQVKLDGSGKPVKDAAGEPIKVSVTLERPQVFTAVVFNGEQVDGLPPLSQPLEQTWNAVERAEKILAASQAKIIHINGNRAFYRSATDEIHLPERGQFPSADAYYATALHELGHWTGHDSRLGRELGNPFGSQAYAKEELRAEIASMILGEELGIGHDPGQHAAYVASWIQVLEEDPKEIVRAAADAEKIHDFVMAFEQELTIKNELGVDAMIEQNSLVQELANLRLAGELDTFLERVQTDLGARLTKGWTGEFQILPIVREENGNARATVGSEIPTGYQVYEFRSRSGVPIKELDDLIEAQRLVEELRLIDALSQTSELMREARLALVQEERIRRDPTSTEEQIVAAKEHRKDLEYKALSAELEAAGIAPHMMGLKEFIAVARVEALENHGRKWEVFWGNQSLGFADAPSMMGALEETHRREVNNAMWQVNSGEQGVVRPPKSVLAQYPDVVVQYPQIADEKPQEKTYINVPFKEKEQVKALGAKWDKGQQSWYVPAGIEIEKFAKWLPESNQQQTVSNQRQYLAVPYEKRGEAKAAGAVWDKAAKSWYAGNNADMDVLSAWLPKPFEQTALPAISPREDFANALREMGCVVTGEHPIMDGLKHRISVEGEKFSERSGAGFYVAHLDGTPAGYIANNKTGQDRKWKYSGSSLSAEEKAQLAAQAAAKLQQRRDEGDRLQEVAAQKINSRMPYLLQVEQATPYLQDKGLSVQSGIYTDTAGQTTYIPAYDADGKVWTMQYIQEDGTKRYAKDSRKEGCFHVVGGMDKLQDAPALVIGEGYATAGTVSEALGFATVAAFDSSNLAHVALALKAQYPDKPIVFIADDDRHLIDPLGVNPGRSKAEEAAKLVGGRVITPVFAPGEQTWPEGLERITKEAFLSDSLTTVQQEAYRRVKQYTDFNDLATKSVLGKEGVQRQVVPVIDRIVQEHDKVRAQELKHTQRKVHTLGDENLARRGARTI